MVWDSAEGLLTIGAKIRLLSALKIRLLMTFWHLDNTQERTSILTTMMALFVPIACFGLSAFASMGTPLDEGNTTFLARLVRAAYKWRQLFRVCPLRPFTRQQ